MRYPRTGRAHSGQRRLTRRDLLGRVAVGGAAAVFLAACGAGKEEGRATTPGAGAAGRAATTVPPTVAATTPEWEQTLAAARREGKVVGNTFTGESYRRILRNFRRPIRTSSWSTPA